MAGASVLFLGACDGQKWEKTQPLFKPHGDHAEHGHDDHAEHGKADDHGKKSDDHAAEGEKKEAPPAEPKTLGLDSK